MIDFVKIELIGIDAISLLQNDLLDFEGEFSIKTGETFFPYKALYRNMKFIVYESGKVYLQGSLHKYFNQGCHNFNYFTYSNLLWVIKDLENKFKIDSKRAVLRNIEIGVNIVTSIKPKVILRALKEHKSKPFHDIPYLSHYKQVIHAQMFVKAYDKGGQYKLDFNLMRFEIKVCKMKYLEKFHCTHLEDLKNKTILSSLGLKLVSVWNECLFFEDSLKALRLGSKTSSKLKDWSNINYWVELREKHKFKDKNKPSREVNEYREIQEKLSDNNQLQLSKKIEFIYFDLLSK